MPHPGRQRANHGEAGISIGELGEFGLIAAMTARMPQAPGTLVGIGDDAAVIEAGGPLVVASTDLLVEGRHFRRDWSGPADVGAKAAAQNLADLAAMGAQPRALLVGMAAPPDLPVAWALDLASGLAQEAAAAGASVVGGDLSQASQIVLAVTALGTMAGVAPVTRSGARPGDLVAVAGSLGLSAAGLALLAAGLADRDDAAAAAVAAHRRPRPPYAAGPEGASYGANSMIDISDGLVQDLGHITTASGAGIDIDSERLAAAPALLAAARALRLDPAAAALDWMLAGGEDHALAATFPPGVSLPPEWVVIGRVREGNGIRVDEKTYRGITGWKHFS
ncbi:MAG TPA: thiamine-phosphate kinase [Streptosporangiaceae bacterium]